MAHTHTPCAVDQYRVPAIGRGRAKESLDSSTVKKYLGGKESLGAPTRGGNHATTSDAHSRY